MATVMTVHTYDALAAHTLSNHYYNSSSSSSSFHHRKMAKSQSSSSSSSSSRRPSFQQQTLQTTSTHDVEMQLTPSSFPLFVVQQPSAAERREQALLLHANSWLFPSEMPVSLDTLRGILHYIRQVMDLQRRPMTDDLENAAFIYAEKFVLRGGQIMVSQLLNLLLIGAISSAKFWIDVGDVSMEGIGRLVGLDRQTMLKMERVFLSTLEYKLYLDQKEVDDFLGVRPSSSASS